MSMFSDNTSIHVMHTPYEDKSRDESVAKIYTEGGVYVHEDREHRGRMATWLGCLASAEKLSKEWAVILSDNALPLRRWRMALYLACRNSPAPVLGLTYDGMPGEKARALSAPYSLGYSFGMRLPRDGAIAFHRSAIQSLALWCPQVIERTGCRHDDILVSAHQLRASQYTSLVTRALFGRVAGVSDTCFPKGPQFTIENTIAPLWSALPRWVRSEHCMNSTERREVTRLSRCGD